MVAETLKLIIGVEVAKAISDIGKVKNQIVDLQKVGQKMVSVGKVMSIGITAPVIAAGVASVNAAAKLEMLQAAFETMLGSSEEATAMISDLQEMASKTPFSTQDLADASKTMLGFGIEAKNILPYLRQIGDVSGGNAQKFSSMALAFSQIQATGRLMGQDLLQLINAGFNPLQTISEKTGESMSQLKGRMEKGGVSAEEIAKAFELASSEGGRFFEGMERASQTFSGQLSTLKDDLIMLGISLAQIVIPMLKEMMGYISRAVKWFDGLDEGTKKTIVSIAGLAAAVGPLLIVGGKAAQGVSRLSEMFNNLGQMVGLSGGQVALIVAALTALAALTVVIIKNWGPISDFFVNLWTTIKQTFWDAYQSVKQIVTAMYEWMIDKLEAMVAPIRNVAEKIKGAFVWLKNELVGQSVIPDMVDMVGGEMGRMNRMLSDPAGPKALADNIEKARKTAAAATSVISSFGDSFATALLSAEDFGDALKIGMRSAIASMLQMLAEYAFVQAGIAFAEVLKGNLTQIPAVAAWTSAGTAAMVAAGAVKAMAEGGIVTRPTMALVGERGPEAVIPLNRAGGMGTTVIVNVQGSVLEEEGLARRITKVVQGAGRGY